MISWLNDLKFALMLIAIMFAYSFDPISWTSYMRAKLEKSRQQTQKFHQATLKVFQYQIS